MTVTLELSPETEADLRERAGKCGQSVADYLLTLTVLSLYRDLSLSERERDIVRERIADRLAGDKGMLLADYQSEVVAKREARKRQQEAETAA